MVFSEGFGPARVSADGLPSAGGSNPVIIVVNKLPLGEVMRAVLVVLGLIGGAYFLWRIQEILFLLFVAILLATAIEPIVNRLRRGPFSRGSGVIVVYTAIILMIALAAYLAVPTALGEGTAFVENLPQRLQTLRGYTQQLQPAALRQAVLGALDEFEAAAQSPGRPRQDELVAAGTTAAQTIISFVSVFVLAFYWLIERASIKRIFLRAVLPRRARDVNTVWLEVEVKLGGWVRGQLLLMLAIACMTGVGYTMLGLPNAALLAAMAGLFEIVPMVGPVLAFAPAVLVALTIDPTRALVVVGYALVIQQLESNILVPRVMRRAVGVSPLTVLLGILIGSTLYGLPGAFVAVPVAGAVQVIFAHLLHAEDASQAEAHADPQERVEQQGGPLPIPAEAPGAS